MGRVITIINSLLIAFDGAFFMNVWYTAHCDYGQCPWSEEPAPLEIQIEKLRAS